MVDAKMHQNAQICTLQFNNFPGAMPQSPLVGEELQRSSPNPTPLALRRCVPSAPRSSPQSLLTVDATGPGELL